MKQISSRKPTAKALTAEFARNCSPSAAKKLRLDLAAVKGLAGLSAEQFGVLGAQLRVRRFRKRMIIYSGKQSGDTVYLILSGVARLTSVNRKNERVLLEVLGPGDVVCIPTLLPDLRHNLECEAFTDCEIGALSAESMVEIVGLEYAKFLLALKLTMGRWWALLVRQSHFIDQTLEERIAVALLDLADKFGLPDDRGTIINLRFGHRNLAELVSGSRPKVSLCLRRFTLEGVLIQERRRIIVMPGKLRTILLRSFEGHPVRAALASR
jgi:CRP/FNR family transcriptional regulator, cyclic AMP receptor protein